MNNLVESLLYCFVLVTEIMIIQILYNVFIFNKTDPLKLAKMTIGTVLSLVVTVALCLLIPKAMTFPVIKEVDSFFDRFISLLSKYVNYTDVFLWFAFPFTLAMIVFVFKGILERLKIRKKFVTSQKNTNKDKTKKEAKVIIDVPKEDLEDVEDGIENIEDDLLQIDYPTTKIKYTGVIGLQRAYEMAKEQGLLLDKQEGDFVAVYSDKKGLTKLKQILSENSLDISKLQGKPSLVIFDKNDIKKVCGIRDEMESIKQKRREQRNK